MATGFATGSIAIATADTIGQTYPVTGLPFDPIALLLWASAESNAADSQTGSQHGRWNVGAVTGTSFRVAGLTQYEDNSAISDSDSMIRTDCAIGMLNNAGAISGRVDIQSLDSGGFTLILDQQYSNASRICWAAFGGDVSNAACGTFAEPGSTGVSQVVTGLSFQPTLVILFGTQATAEDTRADDAMCTLGMMTSSAQWVSSFIGDHNVNPGQTRTYARSGEVAAFMSGDTPSLDCRAEYSAMNSDGFSLNFTSRASTRLFGYLALRGGAFNISAVTTRTDGNNISITSAGVGMPRGCIVVSGCAPENSAGTPSAGAVMSVGAADSISSRLATSVRLNDNVSPTQVVAGIEHDEVLVKTTAAAGIDALMDLASFDADGATFVMDDTEPTTGSWAGVLLLGDTQGVSGDLSAHIGEPICGSSVLN